MRKRQGYQYQSGKKDRKVLFLWDCFRFHWGLDVLCYATLVYMQVLLCEIMYLLICFDSRMHPWRVIVTAPYHLCAWLQLLHFLIYKVKTIFHIKPCLQDKLQSETINKCLPRGACKAKHPLAEARPIRIKSGEPGFLGFSVPGRLGGVICKPEGVA